MNLFNSLLLVILLISVKVSVSQEDSWDLESFEIHKIVCRDQGYSVEPALIDPSKVKLLKYECNSSGYFTFTLDLSIFQRFSNLRAVDISDLRMRFFTVENWTGINTSKLVNLNASHNQLKDVSRSAFQYMPNLREINLSFNKFPIVLENFFTGSAELRIINLAHNQITEVEDTAFLNLHYLEHLDLSYNNLRSFNQLNFLQNVVFRCLDLRQNPLSFFNFNMFSRSVVTVTVLLPSKHVDDLDVVCTNAVCFFQTRKVDK